MDRSARPWEHCGVVHSGGHSHWHLRAARGWSAWGKVWLAGVHHLAAEDLTGHWTRCVGAKMAAGERWRSPKTV